jgi:hypothetical protein
VEMPLESDLFTYKGFNLMLEKKFIAKKYWRYTNWQTMNIVFEDALHLKIA